MTDLLVQVALGNLLISGLLAGIAYVVHRRGRYPGLAHLLWVFVLVKLVTPPLLILPVAQPLAGSGGATGTLEPGGIAVPSMDHVLIGLLLAWGVGSLLVLAVSLTRIVRFDRLLRRTSREAPVGIRQAAAGMARHLGLRSTPLILTSSARLSPMTWWTGGRVRIIIPETLADEVGTQPLQWVLAHELAHVKRRDYLVRWLEFLACAMFWWNPVAWWARQNLRYDEEASCDALVLERFGAEPRAYAGALLAVVEFLSRPSARPPVLATGIDTQGSLERRFMVIISGRRLRRPPRWVVAGLVGTALLLTPLGIGTAAEVPDAASEALAGEVADDDPEGDGSATQLTAEALGVDALAAGDGFAMISATLSDVVALDKAASGETHAKRTVEKAKRAARKTRSAAKETRSAVKGTKDTRLDKTVVVATTPPDGVAAPHGALIGLIAVRLSDHSGPAG